MTERSAHFRVAVDTGHEFTVPFGESILRAARREGCWLPFECGWGSCGTCKATLLEGEVMSLFPAAPAIKPQDARRRRILTCQSTPRSDLRLGQVLATSAPRAELATEGFVGVLEARSPLADDVELFRFALDRPAHFLPGQNAIVDIGPHLRRSYSMSNAPGESAAEFVIKRLSVGAGTKALWMLPPGSTLAMELPYGAAYLRPLRRPPVFIAGGTGIAPILSMLRVLAAAHGPMPRLRILYGANRPADLAAGNTVADLVDAIEGADYVPIVVAPDARWAGAVGMVTDALADRIEAPAEHEFYVSGPPAMVRSTLAWLDAAAVPVNQVHYDTFG